MTNRTSQKTPNNGARLIAFALIALAFWHGGSDAFAEDSNPIVTFESSLGTIKIELFTDQAPISVENFLAYLEDDFYEGTICHRVIPNFMIQCGGFTADLKKKPTRPAIKNEADNGLENERGTVGMARRKALNSATAQFYINSKDNPSLDHGVRGFGYAVFGKVVEGMDVVDQISAVKTAPQKGHKNVPVETVTLQSASLDAVP